MATSQNGYLVPLTLAQQAATLTDVTVPGGVLRLRKGDVATVQLYVFERLCAIEQPEWPGCWSFFVRPIRGQSSGYSNHASGTAFDFSAPKHPRQSFSRYAGWSAAAVAQIHQLLAELGHVVRWGGDYVDKPYDPMHFEINASPAAVAAVAAKIRAGQLPGQKGTNVVDILTTYDQPQAIPAGGAFHTLYVAPSAIAAAAGPANVSGVAILYGRGVPGSRLLVSAYVATKDPKTGTYGTPHGTGTDQVLVDATGAFHEVYPLSADVPAGSRLCVEVSADQPATVTYLRVAAKS